MIWSCGVSFSCSPVLLCCLFGNSVFFPDFLFFSAFFFLCSLKDLGYPAGCCSFSRVPSFRLFPACTLKYPGHPPAVEVFHAFLPSTFFMFGLFLCVGYPSTYYPTPVKCTTTVPSLLCFVFRFDFVPGIFVSCFSVICLLVRAYYCSVPQGYEQRSNEKYLILNMICIYDTSDIIYNALAPTPR